MHRSAAQARVELNILNAHPSFRWCTFQTIATPSPAKASFMKLLVFFTGIAALALAGCASSQPTATRLSADAAVASVCKATKLQRVGPVKKITQPSKSQPIEIIECRLALEGRVYPYIVGRGSDGRVRSFSPKKTWYRPALSPSIDDAIDSTRDRLDAKVKQVCRQMDWKVYGRPGIFRSGEDYVLTYVKVPVKEAKSILARMENAKHTDSFSLTRTFVVTPSGTVLYAANNTTSKDGDILNWKID